MCLSFSLYTRRSIFETLILFGLELLFGLNYNSADTNLDQSNLSPDWSNQANFEFSFLQLACSRILTCIILNIV